jgi:hypothetical protein
MTKVLKMPGVGCRYFIREHCCYEERLNPGLHEDWKCEVLLRLDDRFETLIERDDSELTLEQAGRIWRGWCDAELSGAWSCPDYEYVSGDDGEECCAHLFEDICILRLPVCPGRCSRFVCVSPPFCYE